MLPLTPAPHLVTQDSLGVVVEQDAILVPQALFDAVKGTGARDALGLYSLLEAAPSMFAKLGVSPEHLWQALETAKTTLSTVLPVHMTQSGSAPALSMGAAVPPGSIHRLGSKP